MTNLNSDTLYYKEKSLEIIKNFCKKNNENFDEIKKAVESETDRFFLSIPFEYYKRMYEFCKKNLV